MPDVALEGRDAHLGEGGLECLLRRGIGRAAVVGDREDLEGVRLVARHAVDLADLDVLFAEISAALKQSPTWRSVTVTLPAVESEPSSPRWAVVKYPTPSAIAGRRDPPEAQQLPEHAAAPAPTGGGLGLRRRGPGGLVGIGRLGTADEAAPVAGCDRLVVVREAALADPSLVHGDNLAEDRPRSAM